MFGLSQEEISVLRKLDTPEKIQDFLDAFPSNLSQYSDSCSSPRMALRKGRAHCIEGAFIAATALMLQGKKPLLMDLKAKRPDVDHVVALFKHNGFWGAISKSNHPVLRYRDPVYRTLRELALLFPRICLSEYWGKDSSELFSAIFVETIWNGLDNLGTASLGYRPSVG